MLCVCVVLGWVEIVQVPTQSKIGVGLAWLCLVWYLLGSGLGHRRNKISLANNALEH